MSQHRKNASVARVVQWVVFHLLKCDERGAFIDLGAQYSDCVKVRKKFIGISLVVSSSMFDWLLKYIITKQHTMFLWSIGLYRDVWIAAIAWSRTSLETHFGGNVYYITMQITFPTRKFRNGERNFHCDVVHITTKCVSSLTPDCNGVFAIKAYITLRTADTWPESAVSIGPLLRRVKMQQLRCKPCRHHQLISRR